MSGMRRSMLMSSKMCKINVLAANTSLRDAEVIEGDVYNTQIVCDAGYSIYEITIKMGGVDITSTAYDSTYNMISIPSVTDDVDIECYAMHSMPSDYVRVDGIKNPDNAYLDTGYTLSYKNIVTVDSTLLGGGDGYIIGSKASSSAGTQGTVLRIYTGYSNLWYDPSTRGITEMTGINTVGRNSVVFDHYHGKVYGNGALKMTYNKANYIDAAVACLFKFSPSDAQQSANMIINSCYIYDATTKVYERYYIPCLNDSGVAGFWDAARGVFQGSSNSTAFQPVYVQDNLIAHYDGIDNAGVGVHDASATTWIDLKGSNDATLIDNSVEWGDDCCNSSSTIARFNAGTSIGVDLNQHDFTLEFVAMPTNMTSQTPSLTYSSTRSNSSVTKYFNVFGKYNFGFINNGNTDRVETSATAIDNNKKYHLVIRRKGKAYTVFINGVLAASRTGSNPNANQTGNQYCIGGNYNSYFQGRLYAHRVYTKALTDEEIKGNYNIDKLRFNF